MTVGFITFPAWWWALPEGWNTGVWMIDTWTDAGILTAITLVLLALALVGLYRFKLAGPWRRVYVITALVSLYLNVFVLVVQSFQKVPFLAPLAPTQSEPPFAVAQLVVLVAFVWLGFKAVRGFHPGMSRPFLGMA